MNRNILQISILQFCAERNLGFLEAEELLLACGYESVGGPRYAPIHKRLPATDEDVDEGMCIISPTSFRRFVLAANNTGADLRAFLDAENAYLPLDREGA